MQYKRLKQVLIRHEGRRTHPYDDGLGNITIGIGRNLSGNGISHEEMELMYENDIKAAEELLDAKVFWWRGLDDARQEALLDMAFNMGSRLFQFKNALRLLEGKQFVQAGDAFLKGTGPDGRSRWYYQVGKRALHVTDTLRKGEWTIV